MVQAKITFANNSTLTVSENDNITPIVTETKAAYCDKPKSLYIHTKDGLIPSILDVIAVCDYFRIENNNNKVYNTQSIVSIENI